jgi:hypothetical protein
MVLLPRLATKKSALTSRVVLLAQLMLSVVALRDLQLLERNHDIFLGNAEEPAHANDRGRDVAVAIDHKIGDIADLVFDTPMPIGCAPWWIHVGLVTICGVKVIDDLSPDSPEPAALRIARLRACQAQVLAHGEPPF